MLQHDLNCIGSYNLLFRKKLTLFCEILNPNIKVFFKKAVDNIIGKGYYIDIDNDYHLLRPLI